MGGTGATGATGAIGSQGFQGATGNTGLNLIGSTGATGFSGATGPSSSITIGTTITGNTTLTSASANTYTPCDSSGNIQVTIDPNVFSAADIIILEHTGTGNLRVFPGSGMTLNGNLNSIGQWNILVLFFKSATEATVVGGV
jgi:hypothetical protein